MIFADKLLLLRRQKGLSQEQLAELIEVSRQSVSKWEAQQALPDTSKIVAISNLFNVSIDQLLKDELDIEGGCDVMTTEAGNSSVIPLAVMFCTQCGKENASDSKFCGYCGNSFTSFVTTTEDGKTTKEDMDLAYYKASLQMQQQELWMREQELTEARKQSEQQREQLRLQRKQYRDMMKCPRCGSTSLSGNQKGYSVGKGLVGKAMFGPVGLLAGSIGSGKVVITCMRCGHKFKK